MSYPPKQKIDQVKRRLKSVAGSDLLPEAASKVDQFKYELCKQFVIYLRESGLNQNQLAKRLKLDRARVNDIVKYKISRFTIDWLIDQASKLSPQLKWSIVF